MCMRFFLLSFSDLKPANVMLRDPIEERVNPVVKVSAVAAAAAPAPAATAAAFAAAQAATAALFLHYTHPTLLLCIISFGLLL